MELSYELHAEEVDSLIMLRLLPRKTENNGEFGVFF